MSNMSKAEELVMETPIPSSNQRMGINELLTKCRALHDSVRAFQAYLVTINREHEVDIRTFDNAISSELKTLERLSDANPEQEHTVHSLRSSNLPFLCTIWLTARRSHGVISFNKRIFSETTKSKDVVKRKGALVDLVVQNGEEWIKVSTITERSMLYELAKAGWECGWDSGEDEEEDGSKIIPETIGATAEDRTTEVSEDDDVGKIDLVKVAEDLAKVSNEIKVRYRHPRVRFVLPNIIEGSELRIDKVLAEIRATGAVLECGPTGTRSCKSVTNLPSDDETVFAEMVPSAYPNLTSTLNLDCTILLALISDLSHVSIPPDTSHHRAINKQIESEVSDPLLPNYLYPALIDRDLKCSGPAARRMREIVQTIGTHDEKYRAQIILGDGETRKEKSANDLRQELCQYSERGVPEGLRLPILVDLRPVDMNRLPAVGAKLQGMLSEINYSVFFLGWQREWTTLTSNRTVAKQIEDIIERDAEDIIGPAMWVCSTARSLIGKEKGRRG